MRAYHRVDPLMDERKGHYNPAQFGAFVKVQLLAGRQTRRGWFRSLAALKGMLPSAYARHIAFLIDEGDLIDRDGALYLDGWEEWQEGDLTVSDRMARLRNRQRNGSVTPTVTQPSPPAIGVSSSVSSSVSVSGSDEPTAHDPWDDPEAEAVAWLAKHGCALLPSSGFYRHLVVMVEHHGVNAVVGMFDRLASAGTHEGDVKGYVFGARDALDAKTRPKLGDLAKEERTEEIDRSNRRTLERTQAYLAELRGESA